MSLTIQLFAANSIHVCQKVGRLSLLLKSHTFSVMLQSLPAGFQPNNSHPNTMEKKVNLEKIK